MATTRHETDADGTQRWYDADGELHRDDDRPALVWANGYQSWWQHGLRHRDGDRPAIVYANGDQSWYQHDKLHRDGGRPAIISANGYMAWWVNGTVTGDTKGMGPPPNAVLDGSGTGLLTKSAVKH